MVLGVVEQDLLVDLVGDDHQVVAARDVDEALDDLLAVHRPGRVVGVDDHERVGVLGDLGLDVGEVGVPAVLLVAAVVHRDAAGERHRTGPQRVVGAGTRISLPSSTKACSTIEISSETPLPMKTSSTRVSMSPRAW